MRPSVSSKHLPLRPARVTFAAAPLRRISGANGWDSLSCGGRKSSCRSAAEVRLLPRRSGTNTFTMTQWGGHTSEFRGLKADRIPCESDGGLPLPATGFRR
ncbi:hypothetical protein DAERI_020415 [Deinococcus aerius]|uniref:Uncharacterized protein n=1 Tax=Deinococcus aerius TaxID=200253 RepID=A0A2I9DFI8_9DEIO|nr:hypothetical protein DAERI_020415 [Deinococcus aerius]GMA17662.1 hypothetical protein GCM10025871_39930 [Deinococcus metallilatus]